MIMIQKSIISLNVICFVVNNAENCVDWEKVIDSKVLSDVKPGK